MNQITKTIIISSVIGAIVGSYATFILQNNKRQTDKDLIKEFYEVENAVYVSPHSLRKKMSEGKINDYILIDLRSREEYEKEHIITAINPLISCIIWVFC